MVQAQTPTLAFLRQFGPRWKSGPERGVFRGRRSSKPPWSGCPSPRAAYWPHAKEWPPKRVLDKPRCTGGESCWTPLLLRRAWREFLEHFVHALIQVLDVLVGVVGECVAGCASPEQLLGFAIEQIDDQRAYFICFCGGRCLSETSASSKPVIEGIQGLLILGDFHGYDRNIAARIHLGPAFCCQGGIDGSFDSVDKQGVLRLNAFPRVGLVLPEVDAAIVIGLHLLCRRLACEQKHHSNQNEHDSLQFHNSSFFEIPKQNSSRARAAHSRSGSCCSRRPLVSVSPRKAWCLERHSWNRQNGCQTP